MSPVIAISKLLVEEGVSALFSHLSRHLSRHYGGYPESFNISQRIPNDLKHEYDKDRRFSLEYHIPLFSSAANATVIKLFYPFEQSIALSTDLLKEFFAASNLTRVSSKSLSHLATVGIWIKLRKPICNSLGEFMTKYQKKCN